MPWTLTTALLGPLVGRLVARLKAGTVMSGGLFVMGTGGRGLVICPAGNAICLGGVAANAGGSGESCNDDFQDVGRHQCRACTPFAATLFFAVARRDYFQQMRRNRQVPGTDSRCHGSLEKGREPVDRSPKAGFHHALAVGLSKTMLSIGLVCQSALSRYGLA
jgi:hypothetical protein